jgi:ABC-2 type transport system permease protein
MTFAIQIGFLARRSILRTVRQPAAVIGPLFFPLMLLAINAGGLRVSTLLKDFPTNSFLAFALAVPFIHGGLFATMNGGTDLARDIQTGFFSRLALTPLRGPVLIAGHLAGVVAMGFVQAVVYLSVGLVAGVDIKSGIGGVFVLLLLATIISAGFGAFGALLALRTGSGEAIQGLFPLIFVLFFISSMNTPRNLIAVTWFRWVATVNPISYLIEGIRSLIIEGWNGEALALGFGVALAITALSLTLSAFALRERMTRT